MKTPKKLIEVALPLDDINVAAAKEKSIRHGHPSTLHLWWARRPLAAARAVLFAQLVNDPGGERGYSGRKSRKQADAEREVLFDIIRDLVKWENTNNEAVLKRARDAIWQSWRETCALNKGQPGFDPDKLPAFHDPFAGGGSIPLEAQRLGLEAYASDLNPVAVLINKAMIEIPPKFAGLPPVYPGAQASRLQSADKMSALPGDWPGASGLAEDVRRYGHWMREEAFKRIGHLYPPVDLPPEYGGGKATVIAWLWARTVKSPNPAFAHVEVPLVSSFYLSTKKGKEAWVKPVVEGDRYRFTIAHGTPVDPEAVKRGTKLGRGANFRCILSDTPIEPKYIKAEGMAGRMGQKLMAVVAENPKGKGRIYLEPGARASRPQVFLGAGETPALPKKAPALPQHWHSRGYLPHFEGGEILQTINFRLADSLPSELLANWEEELKHFPKDKRSQERHERIEQALDAGHGECWLRRPEIAGMVQNALHHFDNRRYHLHAWCVMPNHVHALITPLGEWTLSKILHSWKSFTAKEVNKILGRQGAFWEEEYFDRAIRNEYHLEKAVDYILHNPVKAGLCEKWEDWAYAGFVPDFLGTRVSCVRAGETPALPDHESVAASAKPEWWPETPLPDDPRNFWTLNYGLNKFGDLFTSRQLVALNTFADLVQKAREKVIADGARASRPHVSEAGETQAYADAVAVYLGAAVDKVSDYNSNLVIWSPTRDQAKTTFSRQALPMTWDFCELNPLAKAAGDLITSIAGIAKTLERLPGSAGVPPASGQDARAPKAFQANAGNVLISSTCGRDARTPIISSDPPYYDNIGYADLSDFFYVWLRRTLKPVFPDLFSTMTVPKAEELVATPYRHGGKENAEQFFLNGMSQAIHNMAKNTHPAFPVTIYYAFKQSETKETGTISTGWETFLEAVIQAGFSITGTWPMRTEREVRSIGLGTNALASSIVLVCRKRNLDASAISRRQFQRELKEAMANALGIMTGSAGVSPASGQSDRTPGGQDARAPSERDAPSPIAPVDLAQAAIGPGMGVYSQYRAVLEADGTPMPVHDALILINRAIDEYFSEAEGDLDSDSRFCSDWFQQYGFNAGPFGEADVLARAKGTSVDKHPDIIASGAGKVRLLTVKEYPTDWAPKPNTSTWEACHHLIRALQNSETHCGALLARMPERGESIRQLAYRLYTLCERKGRAEDARAYNELMTAWHAVVAASRELGHKGTQNEFGF